MVQKLISSLVKDLVVAPYKVIDTDDDDVDVLLMESGDGLLMEDDSGIELE